ncbi:MAG: septum formation initiator family protein [Clostridia bacterium]|nr:septum formation initiator family protein [Clostridia bacterium]
MERNNKRKKGSFFRRNKIAILFLSILIVYLSITIANQQGKLKDLQREEKELQSIANDLKSEVKEIEKRAEESTSLEFVEKTAREKLKMVKQNEIIYIIQDKKQDE